MRGLDDYEKALWNWINVYNLDAFLQEVYYYYDGKGIYSIALSRGLNLLLVPLRSQVIYSCTNLSQYGRFRDRILDLPSWMYRLH